MDYTSNFDDQFAQHPPGHTIFITLGRGPYKKRGITHWQCQGGGRWLGGWADEATPSVSLERVGRRWVVTDRHATVRASDPRPSRAILEAVKIIANE